MAERVLMYGNEAVARGAYEAGVAMVAAYPGTPSTEITEYAAQYDELHSRWTVNEKVSLETAIGVSIGGGRAMAVMKHVGLNVAADALMTLAYTGVKGGLVVVTADDPGMHSSQNEQDNRWYALMAKMPMLEPADSQEAKDFTRLAFEISEEYDTPVLLRLTTRICHSKTMVELGERLTLDAPEPFEIDIPKYVMVPGFAKKKRIAMVSRMRKLTDLANSIEQNFIVEGEGDVGIVTSGVSYNYVREAAPGMPVLKLGMTHPLPVELIRKFAANVSELKVVEELDTFLETRMQAQGLPVVARDESFQIGELNTDRVKKQINGEREDLSEVYAAPGRPPRLCPGCPHRGTFSVLKDMDLFVSGDIGCYTLGTLPPYQSIHSCVCMGGSMGVANGLGWFLDQHTDKKAVAVLGDSTFIHSGLPELVDMVYQGWKGVVLVLDNSITAMTGRQENPGTGKNIKGEPVIPFEFEKSVTALGATYVKAVPAFKVKELKAAIEEGLAHDGVAVVISREPCKLVARKTK